MISGPEMLMKCALLSFATAFASSVLPVPGGPYSRTPFGASTPSFSKISGCQWKLDHLSDFLDLIFQPSDIFVSDLGNPTKGFTLFRYCEDGSLSYKHRICHWTDPKHLKS